MMMVAVPTHIFQKETNHIYGYCFPSLIRKFTNLINLSSTITKDVFAHIGGKLGELPNQRRETVAIDMIRFLLKNMSRYRHHHHNITPLLYHHATPLLPINHHLYHVTCHPSLLHVSTPSSYNSSPLYVDHHLLFM